MRVVFTSIHILCIDMKTTILQYAVGQFLQPYEMLKNLTVKTELPEDRVDERLNALEY